MNLKQRLEFYKSKIDPSQRLNTWRDVQASYHNRTKVHSVCNPWIKENERFTKKRWIEDTTGIGLRFVGYSDEIVSFINHKGWYTDPFQDETYRGAVWQLPARAGAEQYVHGYEDSINKGSALIDFTLTDDKKDAAIWADSMAQYEAEEAVEFYAKAQAEQDIEEAKEEIGANRKEIKRLLAERKALKKHGHNETVCGLFKSEVSRLLNQIRELKNKVKSLEDNFWESVTGYYQ